MSISTTSSSNSPLVLVTGASGFIGSQIVNELLQNGYRVRGGARGKKVALLKNAFSKYPSFEAVEIPDITSSDLSDTLKGVNAIIHSAAPMPGRVEIDKAIQIAIDGSLHVLRQAVANGITKAVVTGSVASFSIDGPFGADDWNPITKEAAASSSFLTYVAEKKYADMAVAEFADQHPEIDITSLGPVFVYGPFLPNFEELVPEPDYNALSTNYVIHALLRPDNKFWPFSSSFVDVRDVAKAHVLALKSKPSKEVGRKRYILRAPGTVSVADAMKVLREKRPELLTRLPISKEKEAEYPTLQSPPENPTLGVVGDVVGFKEEMYHSWEETVLDTVDSLVHLENVWKQRGFDVVLPESMPGM